MRKFTRAVFFFCLGAIASCGAQAPAYSESYFDKYEFCKIIKTYAEVTMIQRQIRVPKDVMLENARNSRYPKLSEIMVEQSYAEVRHRKESDREAAIKAFGELYYGFCIGGDSAQFK